MVKNQKITLWQNIRALAMILGLCGWMAFCSVYIHVENRDFNWSIFYIVHSAMGQHIEITKQEAQLSIRDRASVLSVEIW